MREVWRRGACLSPARSVPGVRASEIFVRHGMHIHGVAGRVETLLRGTAGLRRDDQGSDQILRWVAQPRARNDVIVP